MSAGHIENLTSKVRWYITGWQALSGLILIVAVWQAENNWTGPIILEYIIIGTLWIVLSLRIGLMVANKVSRPLKFLAQAILHISPNEHLVAAPNLDELRMGRELITSLTREVYQFASSKDETASDDYQNNIIQQIPLPLIGLNNQGDIIYANAAASSYSGQSTDIAGKNIHNVFEMIFPGEQTLDMWLKTCEQASITATTSWEQVKLHLPESREPKYFDMAASFSKDNSSGAEVTLVFFDHTETYSQADNSLSFIALAVHELRTPLTILRGYIEAAVEETDVAKNPQIATYMERMESSAETLSAFVSNILNVARVDQNQLTLQLKEENWANILQATVSEMRLRAQVRGLVIDLKIDPDLPTVAADHVTISEVIINLLDNAIKYKRADGITGIIVKSGLNSEGLIETTVQDFGAGIPTAIMPVIFEKFARNSRNRSAIAGTGLGLYLCKTLVSAHQGQIWVRSKEGEGSTFGFTLLPYTRLAEEYKNSDNNTISKKPHGWIKNHSMYRH